MSKVPHSLDRVMTWARAPWALTDQALDDVYTVLDRRLRDGPHALDQDTILKLTGRAVDEPRPETRTSGAVALIPVHGVIAPRMNMMSDISGGTTFESVTQDINAAAKDPRVSTIVLDVDSPGGSVHGAHDCARAVLAARAIKPVIAHINPVGASAAYWIASCATQVVCASSAQVGSIGVLGVHEDRSAQNEQRGIKREVLSAGEGKTDGSPDGPLTDRARAQMAEHLAFYYGQFIQDVADGRGRQVAAIRDDWQARIFTSDAALAAGLVDKIATLDDTLARFGASLPVPSPMATAAPVPPPDTPQEPSPATGQDRTADLALQRALFAALIQ